MKKQAISKLIMKWSWQLLLLLPLVSCLPEPLEVENIPAVKPEIVVSTQLIPDQSLLVLLTQTFSALDFSEDSDPGRMLEQIALTDAAVSLSGPGGTFPLLSLGSGFYGGVYIPFEEGQVWELRIRSVSLGEAYATTAVQGQVPLTSARARVYYDEYEDSLAHIVYSLQDPPGKNRYMLNVQKIKRNEILQNALNPRAYTKLMDDTGFEGQTFAGEIYTEIPDDYVAGDTIAFTFSNISQEYHQFMQMRLDNRLNFTDFFGEPVNYPSNVVGGKGYFNLHIPDVKIFVLQEDEMQEDAQ